jgi:hypothetical protein
MTKMTNKNALYHVVAEAIRIEFDEKSGAVYLVFELTDEDFKKRIKENWTADIELELEDKKLIIK